MISQMNPEISTKWIDVYMGVSNYIEHGTNIVIWLRNNIDEDNWSMVSGTRYYFKYQDDATLFKLTWL